MCVSKEWDQPAHETRLALYLAHFLFAHGLNHFPQQFGHTKCRGNDQELINRPGLIELVKKILQPGDQGLETVQRKSPRSTDELNKWILILANDFDHQAN